MTYIKNLGCLLIIFLIGISACKNDPQTKPGDLVLGDTAVIKIHETLTNTANGISILMDSVLNDSRCPVDVECVWAGNAKVRFFFKSNIDEIKFSLNTTLMPRDTAINGYKISLLYLLPFPISTHSIPLDEYHANILIQKN